LNSTLGASRNAQEQLSELLNLRPWPTGEDQHSLK